MPRNTKLHRKAEVDFKGEKRPNATHASKTDPDARLYKTSPGTGAMLCFMGHALMENRNGLIGQGALTQGLSREIAAQSPAGQWTAMPNARPRWTWFTAILPDRPGG